MATERLAQCQALVALDPAATVVRFGLGDLYVQARACAQAAAPFAEILRLDPPYSAAYRSLGQASAALGRRAEAAETFQRGIASAEARGALHTVTERRVCLRRLHTSGEAEA